MKIFFKGIGIIVLLLALVNPMYYAYVGYHVELKKIKKEVKNQLISNTPKEELVSFSFLLESEEFNTLEWKHSREFQYNGKMFDIVSADTVNGFVHYVCFPDKQETALNQQFNDLLNERYANDKPSKNKQKMLSNFVKSLFMQDEAVESFFMVQNNLEYNNFFQKIISSTFIEIDNPPPQV